MLCLFILVTFILPCLTIICYDNDQPAKEFLSNLNLGKEFTSIIPKSHKDWNEVLLN